MIKQLLRFWELSVKLWVNLAVAVKNHCRSQVVFLVRASNELLKMIFTSKTPWNMGNMGNMGPVWLDDWPVEHAFQHAAACGSLPSLTPGIMRSSPLRRMKNCWRTIFRWKVRSCGSSIFVDAREVVDLFIYNIIIYFYETYETRKSNVSGKTVNYTVLDCDR